ncbi:MULTISPECIES: alanine acetyltransferase [unclassified Lysobacter]|uniref:alanine acetyltransferase n=1 Tax=unclassified Lysobacter TaxID=2635362 RepID=UPI000A460357|nr:MULTISPECIES: alanine acetyltransferase [unclassified Lysobacter]
MSLWSAQQREWLQALGHPALALASAAPEAAPPSRPDTPAAHERARAELRAPAAERAPERPIERARPATPARGGDDALLRAVLRAAGRRADAAPDEAVLSLYDAATLRGYPAAKRALWPLLRSLRRGSRP